MDEEVSRVNSRGTLVDRSPSVYLFTYTHRLDVCPKILFFNILICFTIRNLKVSLYFWINVSL